jgi:hypothetical protein
MMRTVNAAFAVCSYTSRLAVYAAGKIVLDQRPNWSGGW